ncbi:MAG: cation transporter [Planctomycetes bacterium]|nr:cation transporter [Planctomycetota bacterium]
MHLHATGGRPLAVAAGVSLALAGAKLALGLVSGSLTLLASAADSFADAAMSALNAWGYRWARIPADANHPFGHGKLEGVLSVGQGMLLIGILASLLVGSFLGLSEGRALPRIDIAVAGLVGGGLISAFLTFWLHRASRSDDSLLIKADAAHYRLDFLSAVVAVGGLLAAGHFNLPWLDPLFCLVLAVLMLPDCFRLLRSGGAVLLDEALPEAETARVREVLEALDLPYHGLRTRRSGPLSFVEVHVVLDPRTPLGDAHQLVQAIAGDIREAVAGQVRVLVHPDAAGLADSIDHVLDEGIEDEPQERKADEHDPGTDG